MHSLEIVQLQKSQITDASEIATKAFEEDPVFRYLTPNDPDQRLRAFNWLNSRAIAYCAQHNHVYTTSDLQGIAAWIPPGESSSNPFQLIQLALQFQLHHLPLNVGWKQLGRWLSFLFEVEKAHYQDIGNQPHWYLGVLAVNPKFQRKGVGSQLLEPVLRKASAAGVACYLITFTEQAVQFYQKNGFEVMQTKKLKSDAPPFWTMRRSAESEH